MSTHRTWSGYSVGCRSANRLFIEKSTRYPKRKHAITSTPMSSFVEGSALFQSVRATWNPMRRRLNAAVYTPMLMSGNDRFRL